MPTDDTPAPTRPTDVFAWRTRLLPGSEAAYTRIHNRIPEPVAEALRTAGVIDWRIWRDGVTLFHVIETTDGQEAMGARMAKFGPIDPEWDALIATLLDATEEAKAAPELVWGMDGGGQLP